MKAELLARSPGHSRYPFGKRAGAGHWQATSIVRAPSLTCYHNRVTCMVASWFFPALGGNRHPQTSPHLDPHPGPHFSCHSQMVSEFFRETAHHSVGAGKCKTSLEHPLVPESREGLRKKKQHGVIRGSQESTGRAPSHQSWHNLSDNNPKFKINIPACKINIHRNK